MPAMNRGLKARLRIPAIAILALTSAAPPVLAQGLDSEQAIDTIIGSPVDEQQSSAGDEARRVVAAIEKTPEAIAAVRKISNVGKLEIVYLPDAAEGTAPPAIRDAVSRHEDEIDELRKEIEGNAMLFHAIDSRSLLARDVLAVDFAASDAVVIYAAAQKPD
jgi:hypothetical protein